MRFQLDISKQMRSGGGGFHLRSRFTVEDRALVLFGPSGSGKTLTLQAIAGLLTPDEGGIRVNGAVLFDSSAGVNLPARKRKVGYVFQDYALFPHRSVRDNVGFGLKPLLGSLDMAATKRVEELLELFGLGKLADLRPHELSGGQRQRAALARALAPRPRILLLDEPFSALDQPLRLKMRRELSRVLDSIDIPMVMVTHDSDEVESFAQAVAVYRDGDVVGLHSARDIQARGRSVSEIIRSEVEGAYAET